MDYINNIAQAFEAMAEVEQTKRRTERVVWLLGAGFSKPLGGPLFSELLSENTKRWVKSWLQSRGSPNFYASRTFTAFNKVKGNDVHLWENAEEYLSLVDQARSDPVAKGVLMEALGNDVADKIEDLWKESLQFVAAATSHYVDRVERADKLPEAWEPYRKWSETLSELDSVISFNYDRVVELLLKRANKKLNPLKLHGTVPATLWEDIRDGKDISTIATPGPGKMISMRNSDSEAVWEKAKEALENAQRLVVIGYSFPASDPVVRSFVLSKSKATKVDIVVGPDECGDTIARMFARFLDPKEVRNTRLTAQQFLAEGTARLSVERFDHWLSHPSHKA
jgi:hypothetical protein